MVWREEEADRDAADATKDKSRLGAPKTRRWRSLSGARLLTFDLFFYDEQSPLPLNRSAIKV